MNKPTDIFGSEANVEAHFNQPREQREMKEPEDNETAPQTDGAEFTGIKLSAWTAGGKGFLMCATHQTHPCGCRVIGNGTLTHMLTIEWCPMHKRAAELLEACEFVLNQIYDPNKPMVQGKLYSDCLAPDSDDKTVRTYLLELIAKAKGGS